MSERHTVLILEDNPENAAALRDIVGAMDMKSELASTLDELRAYLATGAHPCAFLADMQVPHTAGARPHEKAGESGIALVQARWKGAARVPIVVVTSYRSDPEYVWAMSELGVDGFCAKSNIVALPEKLRHAMRKVGREDHATCAARARVPDEEARPAAAEGDPRASDAPSADGARVTLEMEGDARRGCTSLRVDGERRVLGDKRYVVLLRLVHARERAPGEWLDRFELGFAEDRSMTTRIREVFRGAVPEGFEVLEGDGNKRFRLNPSVKVKADWEKLGRHPDDGVRAIAEKARGRRGR